MTSECQGLKRGCHLLFDVNYPWRQAPESPLFQLVLIHQSTQVLRWPSSLAIWPLGPWDPLSRCCHVGPLGIPCMSQPDTLGSLLPLGVLLLPMHKAVYGSNYTGTQGSSPHDSPRCLLETLPFLLSSHTPVQRTDLEVKSLIPQILTFLSLYLKASLFFL